MSIPDKNEGLIAPIEPQGTQNTGPGPQSADLNRAARVDEFLDLALYVAERLKAGKPCPTLLDAVARAAKSAGVVESDDFAAKARSYGWAEPK